MNSRPGLPSGNDYRSTRDEFLDTFNDEFPEIQQKVRRDEIGGLDLIVERLDTFKRAISHPQLYEIYGVRPPRGFMLHGPPGCGKTYIARYLSEELGARFVDIPLSKYESKWVGQASESLTEYINMCRLYHAMTDTPVLLFFDEAEEAFKDRNLQGWHGPRVNVLLREMDGLSGDNKGLYFGAATNHLSKVDAALVRPGRLDHIIMFPEYTADALSDVFNAIMIRLNRKSRHFNPFFLTPVDCDVLGSLAYEHRLTPAHVNGLFSDATSAKIKALCAYDKSKVVQKVDCLITIDDLMVGFGVYDEFAVKNRGIGFVV